MKRRYERFGRRAAAALTACALTLCCLTVPASAAGRFRDVPQGHWAAEAIDRAVDAGLFQGQKDGSFGLGRHMTRASFATVLGRLFGWKTVLPSAPSFTDVGRDDWCYAAVETAVANGAVTRQSEAFRPDEAVTREEMSVMLVRCLDLDGLAGLAQSLSLPFQDLTTNSGYAAVAYDLNLMSGFGQGAFAPDRPATREQAAVVLMRLYDGLQTLPTVSAVCGVQAPAGTRPLETVAVSAAGLVCNGRTPSLNKIQDEVATAAVREAAVQGGAKVLLRVSGGHLALLCEPGDTAKLLAETVEEGGWDGLQLDLAQLSGKDKAPLTALVKALRAALPEGRLLYVVAEAPTWQGRSFNGYDYAALGQEADRLLLRVAPYQETVNGFPMAPPEPLEEVYYALRSTAKLVEPDKLGLLLTTTGSLWSGSGDNVRSAGTATAEELEALLQGGAESGYSNRYEAAYLMQEGETRQVAWYLDDQAVTARVRMAALVGVTHVTLSNGASVAEYDDYSILPSLWGE